MNEKEIRSTIENRRNYEAEIMIMRDCSDALNDLESSTYAHRYAILKRRLQLIDHWLHILLAEEKIVLERRLIEGWTWPQITAYMDREYPNEVPCDIRTLQRVQAKALKRLAGFVENIFSSSLDFLIDEDSLMQQNAELSQF